MVLNKVVEQLEWRMAHAPDNSTGWKNPKAEHLLVYDEEEIDPESSNGLRDSLFRVEIKL